MVRISVFCSPSLAYLSLCPSFSPISSIPPLLQIFKSKSPSLYLAFQEPTRQAQLDVLPEPNVHLPLTTSSLDSLPCPVFSLGPWAALPASLMLSLLAQQQEAWEPHLPRLCCQLSGFVNEVHSQYWKLKGSICFSSPANSGTDHVGLPQLAGLCAPCLSPLSRLHGCCSSHSFSTFCSISNLLTGPQAQLDPDS